MPNLKEILYLILMLSNNGNIRAHVRLYNERTDSVACVKTQCPVANVSGVEMTENMEMYSLHLSYVAICCGNERAKLSFPIPEYLHS